MAANTMSEADFVGLVGHRFTGGSYRIAHWENWLLTDCTGRSPMPDDLVHPVALFHVPIQGARTSIAELFELGGAGGPGSVGLESYDWEYLAPLREDVEYTMSGGIVAAERTVSDNGAAADRLAFAIELFDGDALVARITNRWVFRRSS
jgi:hypothetical protein